eukprot:CAMPEP_0115042578 /NCGR_PEP_ID=MMETSP0216-20121206/46348_1 /TAXON_ID=223996 /ORGANISM="Protocruzia adherens, Strain Boccale" /LENGTH=265 /DNA_ID=CAMNT_0002424717 /DNA_START=18 /DNA_END=815 /DNA_ORIENTATION=+
MGNYTSQPLFYRLNSRILKLYLRGVKKYEESSRVKPYNYYNKWGMLIGACYAYKWAKHNFLLNEMEQRETPNILLPRKVYEIRREHHIFWELSRLARGLPKTFTHSNWDPETKMMYHMDLQGSTYFEKFLLHEERPDFMDNPFYERIMKVKDKSPESQIYANKKRYDLDNYLHHKSISVMDWVRTIYNKIVLTFHLADLYHYEQYLRKPDFFYNREREIAGINFQTSHKRKAMDPLFEKFSQRLDDIVEYVEETCGPVNNLDQDN